MGKVIKSAFTPTSYMYDLENNVAADATIPYSKISQTPKNFSKDNYYLHTYQDKVDADWKYRPNRVDVEEEEPFASGVYEPLEAVIQTVKNDKGKDLADDYKRLVFRDIDHHRELGSKYRFSFDFDLEEPDDDKFCWLVTNTNHTDMAAQVVITRCNGTIWSVYKNTDGYNDVHREEIVCGTDLSGTGFSFSDQIVTQKDSIIVMIQSNEFTKQYYVNQRFIIGYNRVYKVTNIQNYNTRSTYKATDEGLIVMYLTIDEKSEKDIFGEEIYGKQNVYLAYNSPEDEITVTPPVVEADYTFKIYEPNPIITELYSDIEQFKCGLFKNGELVEGTPIDVLLTLGTLVPFEVYDPEKYGYAVLITKNDEKFYVVDSIDWDNYVEIVEDDGFGNFALRRLKVYTKKDLVVTVSISEADSPTGKEMKQSFVLSLRGLE